MSERFCPYGQHRVPEDGGKLLKDPRSGKSLWACAACLEFRRSRNKAPAGPAAKPAYTRVPKLELTGQVFGLLTVQAKAPRVPGDPKVRWTCLCECGRTSDVLGQDLTRGHTKSCGCLRRELEAARKRRHIRETPAVPRGREETL